MKLIFVTDNKPVSKIIMKTTSCPWHHVAVAFGDVVIEARFTGVQKTTLSELKSRGKHHIVDVPLSDENKALRFALSQIGKGYDFSGLVGFIANKNLENPRLWYCSELANAIAKHGGVTLVRSGLDTVTQRDLWILPLEEEV